MTRGERYINLEKERKRKLLVGELQDQIEMPEYPVSLRKLVIPTTYFLFLKLRNIQKFKYS